MLQLVAQWGVLEIELVQHFASSCVGRALVLREYVGDSQISRLGDESRITRLSEGALGRPLHVLEETFTSWTRESSHGVVSDETLQAQHRQKWMPVTHS